MGKGCSLAPEGGSVYQQLRRGVKLGASVATCHEVHLDNGHGKTSIWAFGGYNYIMIWIILENGYFFVDFTGSVWLVWPFYFTPSCYFITKIYLELRTIYFFSHPWFVTLAIVKKCKASLIEELSCFVYLFIYHSILRVDEVSTSVTVSAMLHPGPVLHEALVVIYSHEILGVLSTCQYNHLLHFNAAGFPDTIKKGFCQQIIIIVFCSSFQTFIKNPLTYSVQYLRGKCVEDLTTTESDLSSSSVVSPLSDPPIRTVPSGVSQLAW